MEARARVSRTAATTPVLIKIAPDLTLGELDDIVGAARRHRVDGMIVGNTTVARPATLRDQAIAREPGGLSGCPLFALATRILAETYVRVEDAFPLIGVGGIYSGATAVMKIRAGASLIALYSALVFNGLRLLPAIKSELSRALREAGCCAIDEMVGVDAAALTAEKWPA
jgi:dihydroorotate dehydrogenase